MSRAATVDLPYGRAPYPLQLGNRPATIIEAPLAPRAQPLAALLVAALAEPHASPPLHARVAAGGRVTVIVSDATRAEPRAAFLTALRAQLPAVRWTVAVATGTHGPTALEALGIPPDLDATIVNHDGARLDDLVELGTTSRGTPVRVHRCLLDADLVIATGCIRPHYFAGFGAGVKAVFPGLGYAPDIRLNHELKVAPGARAGIVDGNPCRADLEEAGALLPTPLFLLNGVATPDGSIGAVVAGDPRAAFVAGIALAKSWFGVRAPRAPVVIASDALPVTASLYQAAKIAAAVAPLIEADGSLVLVAECANGIGPLEVVNEAIFRIGVLPRLAPGATIYLVSRLTRAEVDTTLLRYAPSVESVLDNQPGAVVVVPRASQLIIEAT